MREPVKEISLDGTTWLGKDDFYSSLLPALGAPPWHGRNLDALNDSLSGGDINLVNPPFVLRVRGQAEMGQGARKVLDRFEELVRSLKASGVEIDVIVE